MPFVMFFDLLPPFSSLVFMYLWIFPRLLNWSIWKSSTCPQWIDTRGPTHRAPGIMGDGRSIIQKCGPENSKMIFFFFKKAFFLVGRWNKEACCAVITFFSSLTSSAEQTAALQSLCNYLFGNCRRCDCRGEPGDRGRAGVRVCAHTLQIISSSADLSQIKTSISLKQNSRWRIHGLMRYSVMVPCALHWDQ